MGLGWAKRLPKQPWHDGDRMELDSVPHTLHSAAVIADCAASRRLHSDFKHDTMVENSSSAARYVKVDVASSEHQAILPHALMLIPFLQVTSNGWLRDN